MLYRKPALLTCTSHQLFGAIEGRTTGLLWDRVSNTTNTTLARTVVTKYNINIYMKSSVTTINIKHVKKKLAESALEYSVGMQAT